MEIYSRADYQTILAALNSLKQRADSGASSAVLAEEIDKRHPILKALKPFLPKDGKDLAAYLSVMIGLATLLNTCSHQSAKAPDRLYIPEPLSEIVIVQSPAAPNTSPPNSQTAPPTPPKPQEL